MKAKCLLAAAFFCGVALTVLVLKLTQSGFNRPHESILVQHEPRGWILRSEHFLYGMPLLTDGRYNFVPDGSTQPVPGVSILVREGFVIGHCDRYKVPLWVSTHWTRARYRATDGIKAPARLFREDLELPVYARATPSYKGPERVDRGHMARHLDNAAWGEDNAEAGCLMSNIAPQRPHLNESVWNALEDEHRKIVAHGKIASVWIISGVIFPEDGPQLRLDNGTAVPSDFYKITAWQDHDGALHMRGYIFPQEAQSSDPRRYLSDIDRIEARTGLDFFPQLERTLQESLESSHFEALWSD